ncbi:hypothetical protein KIN20_036427 [Parelaphostrongylus tenuis]|uniref:Uncharacterized protein n=1 Tax=Parelaphostrongylus tenuis TaxID=148309 RepID=A0AAD5WKE3_PARTN|nr:hypothetical protein KIN20_036427 [Parelaphostrongylus tenuis]
MPQNQVKRWKKKNATSRVTMTHLIRHHFRTCTVYPKPLNILRIDVLEHGSTRCQSLLNDLILDLLTICNTEAINPELTDQAEVNLHIAQKLFRRHSRFIPDQGHHRQQK